jgi:hypothetical protein
MLHSTILYRSPISVGIRAWDWEYFASSNNFYLQSRRLEKRGGGNEHPVADTHIYSFGHLMLFVSNRPTNRTLNSMSCDVHMLHPDIKTDLMTKRVRQQITSFEAVDISTNEKCLFFMTQKNLASN